jgi:spermidine synthase
LPELLSIDPPIPMPRHEAEDDEPATISEADGVRYLHLGTPWVQGAMRIRKPHTIELEYVQRMMVWMLVREPRDIAKGHALQLGLGAGAITRFCHRNLKMQTTAVELSPAVIALCRMWFHLPQDDARLTVLNMDAAQYVADFSHTGTVDVLNVDLYDHAAAAPVLDDEAFYRGCHRMLDDGGVMTVNLFGRDASFPRSARRIADAFGADAVRSVQPTREGNTIVVAVKGAAQGEGFPDRAALAARAGNIETRFGLPARKWVPMIRTLPSDIAAPDASSKAYA